MRISGDFRWISVLIAGSASETMKGVFKETVFHPEGLSATNQT